MTGSTNGDKLILTTPLASTKVAIWILSAIPKR